MNKQIELGELMIISLVNCSIYITENEMDTGFSVIISMGNTSSMILLIDYIVLVISYLICMFREFFMEIKVNLSGQSDL